MKLMFSLARSGDTVGWIGQITSNSFMKREFGTKLIEDYLARVDLQLVVDSSGAYIPGHGTPTVIIVGRNRAPDASTVRAVLGVRGEPGRPDIPTKGLVWTAITEHVDRPGWSDDWITVVDLDRQRLATHPWSLSGGGALELIKRIEDRAVGRMRSIITPPIGRSIRAGADEVFLRPSTWSPRNTDLEEQLRPIVMGENVRDWCFDFSERIFYPYVYGTSKRSMGGLDDELWPWRQLLAARSTFSGDMAAAGLQWWEYMQHTSSAYRTSLSITFAFVATHNHFVLDRGGKVFNRTAPVIKLPDNASEDAHIALLGALNSSTACFWIKQNSQNRGEGGGARVDAGYAARGEPFREIYEFTGTTLQDFPIPEILPLSRARELDLRTQELATFAPSALTVSSVPTHSTVASAKSRSDVLRRQMIAIQEELDWEVYRLYGLIDEDLTYIGDYLPGISSGERAFEIALARRTACGEEETTWFSHPEQVATPITEIPATGLRIIAS